MGARPKPSPLPLTPLTEKGEHQEKHPPAWRYSKARGSILSMAWTRRAKRALWGGPDNQPVALAAASVAQ